MEQAPEPVDIRTRPGHGDSRVDRWIAPYFRDLALWPVMLVLVAHIVLGLGAAILDLIRSGGGFAWFSVLVMGAGTAAALAFDLRRLRIGLTSRALLALWLLSALTAWGADRSGLY